jgi:spore coat polysaccharide biosynthesis protein SpsF (cytidylyltransferase family)
MLKSAAVIIQARTGSERLPKKVLARIQDKPMIWYVIQRVKRVKGVKNIVLATTTKKTDQILLRIAKENRISGFAGSNNDVLDRYYRCAMMYKADPVIRITGDCPLIDPILITKMLRFYSKNDYDYVSNTLKPTYPDGLDVEIFSFKTLEKIWKNAKLPSEREHVTSYIRNNLRQFKTFNYVNDEDLSDHRWTVDEKQDLKFVRKIYSLMHPRKYFTTRQILHLISKNPKLQTINNDILRNEGYLKSLIMDKKIKN